MEEPELKPPAPPDDPNPVVAPPARRLLPRRLAIAAALACVCVVAALTLTLTGGASNGDGGRSASASGTATAAAPAKEPIVPDATAIPPGDSEPEPRKPLRSRPKVVVAVPPGEAPPEDPSTTPSAPTSRPPTDAEVRSELADFREHLTGAGVARGRVPEVRSNGTAVAPLEAPDVVAVVIAAGNEIATTPYKWGGGHGAWRDTGYDCSGSVSFALAGAGLLESPLNSTGFMRYGKPGPGKWITIYANHGHMFMVVAGLRFDTSGARGGTRWQPTSRSTAGFKVRHPPGL